ncbi:MAG TPA: hypothetical protein VMU14_01670 [Acidimicrobiales bacterium]|nr:hypothetical protein [Acidimicrobiales bacterium]
MDGIVALDLALAVVVIAVMVAEIGLGRLGRTCRRLMRRHRVPHPRAGGVEHVREELEAMLAAQVVAGRLSREAYRRRMAELAAADDVRRRLDVPLD